MVLAPIVLVKMLLRVWQVFVLLALALFVHTRTDYAKKCVQQKEWDMRWFFSKEFASYKLCIFFNSAQMRLIESTGARY